MADRWGEVLGGSFGTREGVGADGLDAVEAALGVVLPQSLRELYTFSDGVYEFDGYPCIRPVGDLVGENRDLREAPRLDASVIAIGGDGAGDAFCVRSGATSALYCWYPLDGELRQLAPDLDAFLRGWRDGTIAT